MRSTHHRAQVLALLGDRAVHAPSQLILDRMQLGTQPLGTGHAQNHEPACPGFAATVREAQEVEGLRFALSCTASVVLGKAPELDQPCLVGMQLEPELLQPLRHRTLEALGIALELEPGHPAIRIPHDDHVAAGVALPPLLPHRSNA